MSLISTQQCDLLTIKIYDTEHAMGEAAAQDAAEALRALLDEKDEVNVLFAAAASQRVFLDTLFALPDIDWARVNAFHVDEYTGLNWHDAKSLAWFLESRYFNRIRVKNRFYIDGKAAVKQAECERYAALLREYPADLAFLGVGDNGHLAFNDPHDTRFDEPVDVRLIRIDEVSKAQQVNAGNFPTVSSVPPLAYTVTIPALMRADRLLAMVPTSAKAKAVGLAVKGKIEVSCPASILRKHGQATMYLDRDSASEIL